MTCEQECGTAASRLNPYRELLNNPDAPASDWINVGQLVTDELRKHHPGCYAKWLADSIGTLRTTDPRVVRALDGLGVRLATTNYDGLIESGTANGKLPITWTQRTRATSFFRENTNEVLHLHGHYLDPDSVILGARSYGDICRDQAMQDALRSYLRFGTLLFVGCGAGLEDPNFGSLLEWSRTAVAEEHHSHFILVRDSEVVTWREKLRGVAINPVGYGAYHADLAPFLEGLAQRAQAARDPERLPVLRGSQADFDSQWEALVTTRANMSDVEFFRRSRELAAQLCSAGGQHRAALAFSNRVTFRGEALPAAEFVEFNLDAAHWLLDDALADQAARHLVSAQRRMEGVEIPAAQVARYRLLQVRCMGALCAYAETLQAITEALRQADPDERQRLEAERAEIRWLQGEYDRALLDGEA